MSAETETTKTPSDYLRDLADRIFHIPVVHGVDQGDTDELRSIADELDALADRQDEADKQAASDQKLGAALRRITGHLSAAKPDVFEWYAAEINRAADLLDSGDWKPKPVNRTRVLVDPEDQIDGLVERLLEMVTGVPVGVTGFLHADEQPVPSRDAAERLAQRFHATYEKLAPLHGYETRRESAVPWSDVPERNRSLMIDVCRELLASQPALSLVHVNRELVENPRVRLLPGVETLVVRDDLGRQLDVAAIAWGPVGGAVELWPSMTSDPDRIVADPIITSNAPLDETKTYLVIVVEHPDEVEVEG